LLIALVMAGGILSGCAHGGSPGNIALDAGSTDQLQLYVVIDPSGAVSEVDQQSMPTAGCGMLV